LFSATPHYAIFTYDITDAESFEEMEKWFDLFKRTCGKSCNNINYAIVGTKLDLV
jgi:GTPase SAR1 family protein